MDQNFWFSPGGQVLLSILGSLRIGPRREVLRGGIRPFAPLETYFRLRGAEQLLSKLPQEYQPFARMAVYSGVPVDLSAVYRRGVEEQKEKQLIDNVANALGIPPSLAEVVVRGVVPVEKVYEFVLPQYYDKLREIVSKIRNDEELSADELGLLSKYRKHVDEMLKNQKNAYLAQEAKNTIGLLGDDHPISQELSVLLKSQNYADLEKVLLNVPMAKERVKVESEIQQKLQDAISTGRTDDLIQTLVKYASRGILTDGQVRTIMTVIGDIDPPGFREEIIKQIERDWLPREKDYRVRTRLSIALSQYKMGNIRTKDLLAELGKISSTSEKIERAEGRDDDSVEKQIVSSIREDVRAIRSLIADIAKQPTTPPSVVKNAESMIESLRKKINRYKKTYPRTIGLWENYPDELQNRLNDILKVKGVKKKGSVPDRNTTEDEDSNELGINIKKLIGLTPKS